jgi:hypothetical protein
VFGLSGLLLQKTRSLSFYKIWEPPIPTAAEPKGLVQFTELRCQAGDRHGAEKVLDCRSCAPERSPEKRSNKEFTIGETG